MLALQPCWRRHFSDREYIQQRLIADRFEIANRAAARLCVDALDQQRSDLLRQNRFSEIVPPGTDGAGKMFQEMLHPSVPSREMKGQVRPHETPAQAGPLIHRGVDI